MGIGSEAQSSNLSISRVATPAVVPSERNGRSAEEPHQPVMSRQDKAHLHDSHEEISGSCFG